MSLCQRIGLLLVFCIFFSGCVHTMGRHPRDTDLITSGEQKEKQATFNNYRVRYRDQVFWRPMAQGKDKGSQADANSDSAHRYLAIFEQPREYMENPAPQTARFLNSDQFTNILLFGTATVGAVLGGVLVVTPAISGASQDRRNPMGLVGVFGGGALFGAFTGFIAAVPLVFVNSLFVVPLTDSLAEQDYRNAARSYNVALQTRIDEMVRPAQDTARQPAKQQEQKATQPSE